MSLKKGDYDLAVADYTEAIRLDPKNASAFNGRGFTYASKGDHYRAMADYNESIRLNPWNGSALCNRGTLKLKVKDSTGDDDIRELRAPTSPARRAE